MGLIHKTSNISIDQSEKSTHYETLRTNQNDPDSSEIGAMHGGMGGVTFAKSPERALNINGPVSIHSFFTKTASNQRFMTLQEEEEKEEEPYNPGLMSKSNTFQLTTEEAPKERESLSQRKTIIKRKTTVGRRLTKVGTVISEEKSRRELELRAQIKRIARINSKITTPVSSYTERFIGNYAQRIKLINLHEKFKINEQESLSRPEDLKAKKQMELKNQLSKISKKATLLQDGIPIKMDVLLGEGAFFKIRCFNREFPAKFEIKSMGSDKNSSMKGIEIFISLSKEISEESCLYKIFTPIFRVSFTEDQIGESTEFYMAVIVKKSECLQFNLAFKLKSLNHSSIQKIPNRFQGGLATQSNANLHSGTLFLTASNTNEKESMEKSTGADFNFFDYEDEFMTPIHYDNQWIQHNIDNLSSFYEYNLTKAAKQAEMLEKRINQSKERKKLIMEQKKLSALKFMKRSDEIKRQEQLKRDYFKTYVVLCQLSSNWRELIIVANYIDISLNVMRMAKFAIFFRHMKNVHAAKIQRNYLLFLDRVCPSRPLRELRSFLVYFH